MKIYPNPARSTTYISIPSEMKGKGNLTVTNSEGIVVEEREFSADTTRILSLDLTSQPNGFYKVFLADKNCEVSNEILNLVDQNAAVPV